MLEDRNFALEGKRDQNTPSYAHAVQSLPGSDISRASRMKKLAFSSSEVERRNRLLQRTTTHPTTHPNHADLQLHTKEFITGTFT